MSEHEKKLGDEFRTRIRKVMTRWAFDNRITALAGEVERATIRGLTITLAELVVSTTVEGEPSPTVRKATGDNEKKMRLLAEELLEVVNRYFVSEQNG